MALAVTLLLVVVGCDAPKKALSIFRNHIAHYEKLGELVVVTRAGPLTYTTGDNGDAGGFEHDLVQAFAQELGVPVRFIVARTHDQIYELLNEGKAHLAAAALIRRDDLPAVFSQPIRELEHVIVQHEDSIAIDDLDELKGHTVEVLAGSPQAALLKSLLPTLPGLTVSEIVAPGEIDVLERVNRRWSGLAATDSAHFELASDFYPALEEALTLPGKAKLAWAFPRDTDLELVERANRFIAASTKNGTLARLIDRYFGHVHRLSTVEVSIFLERLQTLLPRYRREFVRAQELTGIDWRLLAALAYQESQWDPFAASPTGVRGFMMITAETADRLKVTNRLDARQSIGAGARYLADLRDQLPPDVAEPDRTWLALAAYNLGLGHLNGARTIARSVNRDPDSWYEMKSVLPLLSRPEYAKRLKGGAARGGEAVTMVENIRTFYDIISRHERPHTTKKLTLR